MLVGVLMVSSLLNIAYLLPIPIRGFFSAPDGEDGDDGAGGIREAPALCVAALLITAFGSFALFFFPEPIHHLLSLIFSA